MTDSQRQRRLRQLARIRAILGSSKDAVINRARDEEQERRTGRQWPVVTRSTYDADFRIGDDR
jgi:hypothetical protein